MNVKFWVVAAALNCTFGHFANNIAAERHASRGAGGKVHFTRRAEYRANWRDGRLRRAK